MTYIQEIELLLQTAEKIDEEMQHKLSHELFLILLAVLLVILMLMMDNINHRAVMFGPLFWVLYISAQTHIKLATDAKTKFELVDKADVILSSPEFKPSVLSKNVYAMRINRLKS